MTADGPLLVSSEGLWIPPELRDFEAQIVIRTPRATVQHFGGEGSSIGPFYGMVDATHFGLDPDDPATKNAKNPELAPDRVSIKPQGEEAQEFGVKVIGE